MLVYTDLLWCYNIQWNTDTIFLSIKSIIKGGLVYLSYILKERMSKKSGKKDPIYTVMSFLNFQFGFNDLYEELIFFIVRKKRISYLNC